MFLAESGGLLEGVGELEDGEILLVAADDLNADGESFGSEAGRHGGSRVTGGGDVPAGLHPIDVAGEFHAGDLGGVGRVDVEGRQLRGGENEILVLLKEGLETAPDPAVGGFGARDIGAGEALSFADLGREGVLESFGMLAQLAAVNGRGVPGAQQAEAGFGGGKIGLGLFDDAAERFEGGAMGVHHGADARVEGNATETPEPGDAHTFETAAEGQGKEFAGVVNGERVTGIGTGDGAEGEGEVGDGTRQASGCAQGGPGEGRFRIGYTADRRAEAGDVAEGGGVAEGASHVGTTGDGDEAAGQRDGGAAGRSAAGLRQIVGIAGGAEDPVEGLGPGAEFRGVGFAESNGAGQTHALDDEVVFGGDVILEERGAEGGTDAAGFHEVLVGNREAVKRAQLLFVSLFLVGGRSRGGGHLRYEGDDGVDLRVDAADLFEVFGEGLARRESAGADEAGHLDRAEEANRAGGSLGARSGGRQRCGAEGVERFAAAQIAHVCDGSIILTMSLTVEQLEPKAVWKHFAALAAIPRASEKEAAAREYVLNLARRLGLEAIQDDAGNVVVCKPARPGREAAIPAVIQGHLDMVCEKNEGTVHNFDTDPIRPVVDGDWLKAEGTTLGADNGVGVAAALAVMESGTVAHGPLEFVFTIDEESGLTGASRFSGGVLKSKYFFNLDNEEEFTLCIGCAGGVNSVARRKIARRPAPAGEGWRIKISGLAGGHSGVDIHRGRGNAVRILGRGLLAVMDRLPAAVADIQGGSKRNAIPREAFAVVVLDAAHERELQNVLAAYEAETKAELGSFDPGLKIAVEPAARPAQTIDQADAAAIAGMLASQHHGVLAMSPDIPGLVQTSTNLATVSTSGEKVEIATSQRSSIESSKRAAARMVATAFRFAGFEVEQSGDYPGWKPEPASDIVKMSQAVHESVFGKPAELIAMHAGLECGVIGEKYPGMQMISFGPQIVDVHSPSERIKISSVGPFYRLLTGVLERL